MTFGKRYIRAIDRKMDFAFIFESRYSPLLKIWKVFNGCVIIFFKNPKWTTTKHVVDFSKRELGKLGHKSMKNLLFLNYK